MYFDMLKSHLNFCSSLIENGGPEFGKIYKTYNVDDDFFFVLNYISTIACDQHYHAWNIRIDNNHNYIKKQKLLPHIGPYLLVRKKGLNYISMKHWL